jgi:hypothetical protein
MPGAKSIEDAVTGATDGARINQMADRTEAEL